MDKDSPNKNYELFIELTSHLLKTHMKNTENSKGKVEDDDE
jgi:hypothetical protein